MQILIKIEQSLADRLLRLVKAESTQDAVNKVLENYVKGK